MKGTVLPPPLLARSAAVLDRWIDALVDPQRRTRAMIWTLAAYAALWTAFRAISTLPRDIHVDVAELYAWSQALAFGYDKHPPLSAAIARLWLTLVPASDLAFHALAAVNVTVTLFIAWRTMLRLMAADKALFGVALLTLIPLLNVIALKYNANAVLLPFWALTIDWFLRAWQSRSAAWGALAGLGAGLSMLGKYWSIVLVAALGLAALSDPRRGAFFRSPAPWLMIGVGAAVLAPHLWWLAANNAPTFSYAGDHAAGGFGANLLNCLSYLAGCAGYIAPPVLLWLALLRPDRAALRDALAPADADRRMIAVIQAALILLPIPIALASGLRLVPLWTMPGWTLLPVVLMASPRLALPRARLRIGVALAAIVPLAMLCAAPLIALATHLTARLDYSDYASLLAPRIEQAWREHSSAPIPLVAGDPHLGYAAAYYLRAPARLIGVGRDEAVRQEARRSGGVIVCNADDGVCLSIAAAMVKDQPAIIRGEARLSRPLFGYPGGAVRDVFFIIPPPARAER